MGWVDNSWTYLNGSQTGHFLQYGGATTLVNTTVSGQFLTNLKRSFKSVYLYGWVRLYNSYDSNSGGVWIYKDNSVFEYDMNTGGSDDGPLIVSENATIQLSTVSSSVRLLVEHFVGSRGRGNADARWTMRFDK